MTGALEPRGSGIVAASYVALSAVVWFNNGIGPILPAIEDEIGGGAAAVYPLVPGAVMLLWSLSIVFRPKRSTKEPNRVAAMIVGSLSMAAAVIIMGVARWAAISVIGVALAAFASAYVVRALTSLLKSASGNDVERTLMRGNAYASLASVASPLAVAGSIAVGLGWMPGIAAPVAAGAIAIVVLVRTEVNGEPSPTTAEVAPSSTTTEVEPASVPAFRMWWREYSALTLGIVIEFCFVFFAATYLHDELGMSKAAAAGGAAAWGAGMAIGRFAISARSGSSTVARSVMVIAVGFGLLWTTGSDVVAITGIGIAGLGAAPLYPSRLAELLYKFPSAPDEGATRGLLGSGTAVLAAPALIAGLRAVSDVRTAFLVVPALLGALLILTRSATRDTPASR